MYYFWLSWVFTAAHGLIIIAHRHSLFVVSGGYSLVAVHGHLIEVASFAEHGLYKAQASVVVAHGLSSHVPRACLPHSMWDLSSQTRDQTHVHCTGRRIPNHWTTREDLAIS